MADTIQELYGSFSEQMAPIQEEDRYFRYLYEMAQASDTTIEQKREELVKQVDERWISIVEDSLDSLNEVVRNPRRFVTTEEELVPVALARKISADSVRHLSQNTQFIDPSDDGEIHPSKILNVSTQETYDLYENRFIYHLIKRLVTFVDKRTDVIFWRTGNELRNHFIMHSTIEDAYEQIEYNIDMTVKNLQSVAENEQDNMDVFMRIDRVRRVVLSLQKSSFFEIMNGCAKVRSPIQRTNLIMKDPDYRKCYQLWQFIESYDEVGYSIEVRDTEMAVDDEYMVQMYTNLINNYTVFKSLTLDERKLTEIEETRHEVKKPKFIHEVQEQYVDDCNLPDVEIRQVYVDEVTRKQIEAEAALAEEQEARAAVETQLAEAKHQIVILTDENASLNTMLEEAQDKAATATQRMHDAEMARGMAEKSKMNIESQYMEAKEAAAAAEATAASAVEAQAVAEAAATTAQQQVLDMRSQTYGEIEAIQAQAQQFAQETRDKAAASIAEARATAVADAEARVAAAQAEADAQVSATLADTEARIAATQESADSAVAAARAEADAAVAAARAEADAAVAAAHADAEARVAEIQAAADASVAKAQMSADAAVTAVRDEAAARVDAIQTEANAKSEAERIRSDAAMTALQERSAAEIDQMRTQSESDLAATKEAAAAEIAKLQRESDSRFEKASTEYAETLKRTQDDAADAIEKMKRSHAAEVQRLQADAAHAKQEAEKEIAELRRRLQRVERERDRAQRRAESNGITHLLKKRAGESEVPKDDDVDDGGAEE